MKAGGTASARLARFTEAVGRICRGLPAPASRSPRPLLRKRTTELTAAERLNFLVTNRIPRRWATLLIGRISLIRSFTFTRIGIRIWETFGGKLELHEAKQRRFRSLQECFTRELAPGRRPLDTRSGILTSPCDGIVGQFGTVAGTTVFQAKGFPYSLEDLLADERLVETYRNGHYATLRLRSNMYHRFHAPTDCLVSRISYLSGDTWNVNPIALKCVERLFCRNERAIVELTPSAEALGPVVLVPVAAILVASMRFTFLDTTMDLGYSGPTTIDCAQLLRHGEEIGHFRLGSTILVFTTDALRPCAALRDGGPVKMGQPLFEPAVPHRPSPAADNRVAVINASH